VVKALCVLLSEIALISTAQALTLSAEDEGARDAARQWLQVVDSGNYQDATLQIAQEVRGTRDWRKHLADHRAPLGRVTKRQLTERRHATSIPEIPGVRSYTIVRFQTLFERGSSIEQLTLAKMGCCWEVVGYEVR
jgi:hypothetical protein